MKICKVRILMKRIMIGIGILLVSLFFLNIQSLYAQTKNEHIENYFKNEIGPWAVIKLTEAYLKDYEIQKLGFTSEETDGFNLFVNEFCSNAPNTIDDPAIYFEDARLLLHENAWADCSQTVFEEFVKNYENALQKKQYEIEVFTFQPKRIKKKGFRNEFNELYASTLKERIAFFKKQVVNPASSISQNYSLLWYSLGGNAIFLLIIIFLFFYMKSNKKKLRKEKNQKLDGKKQGENYYSLDHLKKRVKILEKELIDKEKELKNLNKFGNVKSQKSSLKESCQYNSTNEEVARVEVFEIAPSQANNKIEYYVPYPYISLKFDKGQQSSKPLQTTFYRIELKEGELNGNLYIHPNKDLVRRAINSPELYLKSACEYVNVPEKHHKDIKTDRAGTVILHGEDWIVKEKVKIKFV